MGIRRMLDRRAKRKAEKEQHAHDNLMRLLQESAYIEYREPEYIGRIIGVVHEKNVKVYDVEITKAQPKSGLLPNIVLSVRLPKKYSHTDFLAALSEIDGVTLVEEL